MGNSAGRKMDRVGKELAQSTNSLNQHINRAVGNNNGRFQTGGRGSKTRKKTNTRKAKPNTYKAVTKKRKK